ncbi:MAG: dockerin type I repeat-containing protein [Clostridia bacterium]|nr:dockerin type I repeat-containing protein [Clostridia bacterium]
MLFKRLFAGALVFALALSLLITAAGKYGDYNGSENVTSEDAIYLLRHVLFPDDYPIDTFADFDGSGSVDSNDAIYLLRHVLFPGDYPLLITVYEPNNNVARGKTYTASEPFTANPPSMGYQDIDGKELTDGVRFSGTDLYATCWHAFDYRKYKSTDGEGQVVIDLGSVTVGLIEFRAEMINYATSGIDAPTYMKVFVSQDGSEYTALGSMRPTGGNICDYVCKLKEPVSGRYVKITIGIPVSGVFMFCSEMEVYDSKTVRKEESELSEEESYEETSEPAAEETGVVETGVLDTAEYPLEFRTGSRFKLENGKLTGVVAGDTPASICRELVSMAGVQILDKSGKAVTSGAVADGYSLVQYSDKTIAKKYVIEISASSVEPSAPLTAKATVKHTSSVLYTLTTLDKTGKTIKLTFDKKDWGTWNIGTWYIDNLRLAGGGTDWEYVFRAASSASSEIVWSGGNHGNETLVSLKFYEGTTGEEIDLSAVGASHDFDCFVIKETTRLHWGDASSYYANVVRTYKIIGRTIYLDVTYDFVKDCWYQLSYTCMFPVPKTHGLYIDFLNDDGTTAKAVSKKVGAADYSGPFYGNLPASAARIYGYQDTQYSFLVQVYTKNDSVNNFTNTNKLMYWDMNTNENKLYFTKFSMDSRTKVASGSHWDTACSWTLLIDDE